MQYILLINVAPEGMRAIEDDPMLPLKVDRGVVVPGVTALGIYGVLGPYDYVAILEAPNNDSAARWSVAFGSRMQAKVTTMPAVPISHFTEPGGSGGRESAEQTIGDSGAVG